MSGVERAEKREGPPPDPATMVVATGGPSDDVAGLTGRGYRLGLWLNLIGLTLAVVPVLARLLGAWRNNDSWEYAATEWLINSRGGVTRRGLAGDVLLGVPFVTDRGALLTSVLLLVVAVPVGFAVLVFWAMRTLNSPWPVIFWLLPGGLVMATLQASIHGLSTAMTDFAMRKDYLFFALILAVVLASLRWQSRRAWQVIAVGSSLACALGVFVHEGVAFVTCGILAYYLVWLHPQRPQPLIRIRFRRSATSGSGGSAPVPTAVFLVIPTVVALAIVALMGSVVSPDYRVAWAAVDPATLEWLSVATLQMWGADTGLPNSFWWLNTQVLDGWDWIVRDYVNTGAWVAWLLTTVAVVAWAILAALLVDSSRRARRHYLVHMAVLAVLLSPLYVVAIDWGRWVAFLVVSFSILVLGQFAADTRERPAPARQGWKLAVATLMVIASLALVVPVAGNDFWLVRALS